MLDLSSMFVTFIVAPGVPVTRWGLWPFTSSGGGVAIDAPEQNTLRSG
jgi:hypothetical protein